MTTERLCSIKFAATQVQTKRFTDVRLSFEGLPEGAYAGCHEKVCYCVVVIGKLLFGGVLSILRA